MITRKIAMPGMWGVGKTSLVQQFVSSVYDEKYLTTIGVKVDKKIVTVGDQQATLMLWDIAGAEEHFSVPLHYIRGAAGYVLVVDGTRPESLTCAVDLRAEVAEGIGDLPCVVAANKADLDWALTNADIDQAFPHANSPWFRTSAKTGANVEAAFTQLAEMIIS